jgi:hypothetical protein
MNLENEADTGVFHLAPVDKWLVRTEKNVITGPFSTERVRQLILEGKLAGQDEVCRSNSYWIYLHESDEVLKQLNVRLPSPVPSEGRGEQTETAIDLRLSLESGASHGPGEGIPDLDANLTEETAVLSNRALREFRPRGQDKSAPEVSESAKDFFRATVLAHTEQPSYWRILAVILTVATTVLLVLMIWLLSTRAKR